MAPTTSSPSSADSEADSKTPTAAASPGLRLYGSYARSEARADSDIDLLVLLHGEVDRWTEIDRLVDLSYDLELETGRIFELLPRSVAEFEAAGSPFLRSVHREGLVA